MTPVGTSLSEQSAVELEQQGTSLVDAATALLITTPAVYERACAMLLDAKAGLKSCDEAFDGDIARWHDGHKQALATKAKYAAPFKQIETILKPRIGSYLAVEEQKRREAERKAQEAAQLQEAVDAEQRGDKTGMEDALNGRGVVSIRVPSAAPKVSGIAQRENWSAQVDDLMQLVKAVAAGQVPPEVLLPNMVVLNQQARSLKQSLKYPGVRAICVNTVAAGRSIASARN